MTTNKIDIAALLADDHSTRPPKWEPRMGADQSGWRSSIQLLGRKGQILISEGDTPTASIEFGGVVMSGIDLHICGELIEALCEAEWYLIGPPQ